MTEQIPLPTQGNAAFLDDWLAEGRNILGERGIGEVSRSDVGALLDALLATGRVVKAPTEADVFAYEAKVLDAAAEALRQHGERVASGRLRTLAVTLRERGYMSSLPES